MKNASSKKTGSAKKTARKLDGGSLKKVKGGFSRKYDNSKGISSKAIG